MTTPDTAEIIQELDNAITHCRDAEDDNAAAAVQSAIDQIRRHFPLVEALATIETRCPIDPKIPAQLYCINLSGSEIAGLRLILSHYLIPTT